VRLNHIGDWGTQFGMLIQYMAEEPGGLEASSSQAVSDLQVLYRCALLGMRGWCLGQQEGAGQARGGGGGGGLGR
jgi:hypothetical protein